MMSMYLSSFVMPIIAKNYSDFLLRHRALVTRRLSQGYKVNRLSNTFKNFYGRYMDFSWTMQEKCVKLFADSIS